MLQSKAVVEELVESSLLEFILVAKLNLEHVPFIYIRVADHVLGQIDSLQAGVILQDLRENKQVLRVEALVAQVELDQLVGLDSSDRHVAAIDTDSFSINLADEFRQVLQAELVHILVAEVHDSVGVGSVEHLTGKNWVAKEFSQDLGGREDVLT